MTFGGASQRHGVVGLVVAEPEIVRDALDKEIPKRTAALDR